MEEVTDIGAATRRDLSALLVDVARALLRDGVPRAAGAGLRPGTALSDCVELVRVLGRRGSGASWEARDRFDQRPLAVRFLRRRAPWLAPLDPRDAEALAHLDHPNIAQFRDAGVHGGAPYVVLDLLRGETLEAALARGPLAPERALAVAIDVAKALAHAHHAGIVHRNLKPSNVFLAEGGAKVLGLGLALLLGGPVDDDDEPRYVPPERQRGRAEDERTDVWALGVMLHEMLCGELPPGSGAVAPAAAATPPGGDLFPGLADVVARMTSPVPARRPRDGVDALAELLHLHDVSSVRRASRRRSRRATPWIATALVGVGFLAAALPDPSVEPDPEDAPAAVGLAGAARRAPDGPSGQSWDPTALLAAACGLPPLDEKERAVAHAWRSAPEGRREEALRELVAAHPGDQEVLRLAGEALWHAGTPDGPAQAVALFRRALDLDPDDARARAHLLEWAVPRLE